MIVRVDSDRHGADRRRTAERTASWTCTTVRRSARLGFRVLLAAASCGIVLSAPLPAQSGEAGEFVGLPPAPSYIPGTMITPQRDAALTDPADAPSAPRVVSSEPLDAAAPSAGSRAAATGAAGAEPSLSHSAVWRKLVPLLPEPGNFAIIPGSALTPHLVGDNEFAFCGEIKCHRSATVLGAWNGGAFDRQRGEFRVHGGGHADYGGNEVYAFDFATLSWTRETDPQPLTGPYLRDTDGDGENDACPAPAVGPPAMHTYQGFLYVPKIDRYWLLGTVEYCSNGMGGSSAWEYDAGSRTWTAMPELDPYAKFTRAVIDPRSGNVIVHVGRERGWHEIDPESRAVVRSYVKDPFGTFIDGPAVFDQDAGVLYALVEGRAVDRLLAYDWPPPGQSKGFAGRLVAEWPKEGKKAWGMAQHASGLLVLWDGNDRILVVDPATGAAREAEPGGSDYDAMSRGERPGKVYSKWAYIPEVDAFFGITNADLGIVLYRLDRSASATRGTPRPDTGRTAGGAIIRVADTTRVAAAPAEMARLAAGPHAAPRDGGEIIPLEIEQTADWREVCAAAVLCDPLGEGEVLYRGEVVESGPPQRDGSWRNVGQKYDHPEAVLAEADPEVGGLRFTFPSNSGSGAAGNFKTNFSPDYSFQVGPAEAGAPAQEVFIQFQVRYSCTFIWTDCDPTSPNYRKERRCFRDTNGKGGCTASKIALISTGDRHDDRADACMRLQTAINHNANHALHAFHRCPRPQGFGERIGRTGAGLQSNSQPNGLFHCPRLLADSSKRGWENLAASCFRLIDDRWITIQIRLRFGPWQADARKGDPRLSHVSIWGGIEGVAGGRQRLVIDNEFYASSPNHPGELIGKIWLMPHLYEKNPEEEHPPFFVWYRNLVISESLIANPA